MEISTLTDQEMFPWLLRDSSVTIDENAPTTQLLETVYVPGLGKPPIAYRIWVTPAGNPNDFLLIAVKCLSWEDHEDDCTNSAGPDIHRGSYPFAISYVPANWVQGPLPTTVCARLIQVLQRHLPQFWHFLTTTEHVTRIRGHQA